VSVAARSEPRLAGARSERWPSLLPGALALVLVAATVEIVLDAAAGHTPLVPKQPASAFWLGGLGEKLGYRVFLIALLASCAAYAGLLASLRPRAGSQAGRRGALGDRGVLALVAALQLIVFVGPVLISTDVFSYIAYARMGVEHGINPYLHGPAAIASDPVYRYVGQVWRHTETAYGPLYTLLSYPFAPLGVVGALWGMKGLALIASAGTLALTRRCARARGHDATFALLAVGANPLYVIYGLGGAHNDLLMLLAMMASVAVTLSVPAAGEPAPAGAAGAGPVGGRGREAAAAAILVAGALIKATVAALLPFMLLARRRLAPLGGALLAAGAGALIAYAAFGVHGVDVVAALNRDAALVSSDSFPTEIAHLFGKPGVFPVDHDLLKAALVVIVVHLLWRTWRGYDWIAASGWTLLAISVTSTWLLAWYILWPLPLAMIARDRRLLAATLFVQALFVVHQITPLLVSPVQ
jgi:hypothetical protein